MVTGFRRVVALVLLGLALALAGCGDDDGGSGGDTMTAAEFRTKARAICKDTSKAANNLTPADESPDAFADYLEKVLDVNAKTRARFVALKPPPELRAAHREAIASNDEGAEYTKDLIERFRRAKTVKSVLTSEVGQRIKAIQRRTAAAAKRLGVPECGQNPG